MMLLSFIVTSNQFDETLLLIRWFILSSPLSQIRFPLVRNVSIFLRFLTIPNISFKSISLKILSQRKSIKKSFFLLFHTNVTHEEFRKVTYDFSIFETISNRNVRILSVQISFFSPYPPRSILVSLGSIGILQQTLVITDLLESLEKLDEIENVKDMFCSVYFHDDFIWYHFMKLLVLQFYGLFFFVREVTRTVFGLSLLWVRGTGSKFSSFNIVLLIQV